MSRQISESLCFTVEWMKGATRFLYLLHSTSFQQKKKSKVCIYFSSLSATLRWAQLLHPSLCCAPLPLKKCQMCVNIIQADSLRGPHWWPLLVLHLRARLMLVGRVGSSLCEGSPVMGSKQGNRPSLTAQSFKTAVFFFFNLTCTTLYSLSCLLLCCFVLWLLVL